MNTVTHKAEFAEVSIAGLCGIPNRVPIQRSGKSIIVFYLDKRYRLDAAKFDAGESQFRQSQSFRKWTDESDRRVEETRREWEPL